MRVVLTALFWVSVAASGQQAGIDSYNSKLGQTCAGKHLEMLPPAELLDVVDGFSRTLTPPQQETLHAARVAACTNSQAGASCENDGFLQAAAAMGVLDQFVSRVCALPETCTAQSACTRRTS